MGWIWTKRFGWNVVKIICDAISKPIPETLLGQPMTTKIFTWNTEAFKPLTQRFKHPFDVFTKLVLPKKFSRKYFAQLDKSIIVNNDEDLTAIDPTTISNKKPICQIA